MGQTANDVCSDRSFFSRAAIDRSVMKCDAVNFCI
jgi:hypothetical protein